MKEQEYKSTRIQKYKSTKENKFNMKRVQENKKKYYKSKRVHK